MAGLNTAAELLEKLKPGDVVLFHKKGLNPASLPIKLANFFQNGFEQRGWTHAGFYLGGDEVVEAYGDGIQINPVSGRYLKDNYNLLFLRRKNAPPEKLRSALDFCVSEKGEKYDTWGLGYFLVFNFIPQQFHFILNFHGFANRFNNETRYFCSELVARGFQEAGIYCFERESFKIMPSDFNNPLLFEEVGRVALPSDHGPAAKVKNAAFFVFYLLAAVAVMLLSSLLVLLVLGLFLAVVYFSVRRVKRG